jgi:hypothetical protein
MASRDSTAPLEASERAAVARFLDQAHATLLDDRITAERGHYILGFLVDALHRAAVDVRRGNRSADLDTVTSDLARRVEQLAIGERVT